MIAAAAAASAPVTPYIYRYSTSSMSLRRTSLVRGWAQASAGKPEAIDFTLDQGISRAAVVPACETCCS